jgi:hypothetical protein
MNAEVLQALMADDLFGNALMRRSSMRSMMRKMWPIFVVPVGLWLGSIVVEVHLLLT